MKDARLELLNKRENMGTMEIVGTLIGISVFVAIGLWVLVLVFDTIDTGSFSAEQNATYDAIVSNSNNALELTTILPIVLVTGAVIGAITFYFRA